jgi:hypothetical protein
MTGSNTLGSLAVCLLVLAVGAATAHALPITNGSFESGNTGFTSDYTFSPADYTPPGIYAVDTSPALHHGAFADYAAYDGEYMMIVNGANTPGATVWASSTTVAPGTTYYLSAWVASAVGASPAELNFSINGNPIGTTFTAPSTTGTWEQFFAMWNSGPSTTADLSLVNQNTAFSGNDFTIDLIVLGTEKPGGTNTSIIPEPTSMLFLLTGLGALGLVAARRRMRR